MRALDVVEQERLRLRSCPGPGRLAALVLTAAALAVIVPGTLAGDAQAQTSTAPAAAHRPPGGPDRLTGERVLHSWRDTVKLGAREVERRVEIVFDYDAGVAFERVYDTADQLQSQTQLAVAPEASREEIDDALARARANPSVEAFLRQPNRRLVGGFIVHDQSGPCGPGSRCLHVLQMEGPRADSDVHRRLVVDLMSRRVYQRDFGRGTPPAMRELDEAER